MRKDPTLCRECDKPHYLSDDQAGTEREIERLCSTCYVTFPLIERNNKLENNIEMKKRILGTIEDLCSNFLYYDRKEDEDLSPKDLREAVETGIITIDEMVAEFRKHLTNSFYA